MAKSIKKAAIGASQPPAKEKGKMKMDTSSMNKFKKVSVGKKKPVTDMQRDEMGRPVSPKQKSESLKGLQESVQYKGRPKMKSGGTLSPSKKSVGKTIGKLNKAKSGGSFPDLNKDGKVTKKDVLIGRGVLPKTAKKGTKVGAKKMMGGGKCKYGCK